MSASDEAVRRVVHEVITEILPAVPGDRIPGDAHLRDLGADSIDRVEIILTLRERLGVDEPLGSFSDLPDIDHLVAYLCEVTA
ncbi:acyl carrier protein [Micromonospora aurantiaca]|uniref:Acyl carrier protein n=1 Tax=Micromonospora aurantiaca (nom. illeg.) TaxID=47850 RepID=A0A1C6TPN0_9ACTN|nr:MULTISPECIES: acyl carrier protein [Micromonospora]AXH93310.1 acyl carrier protein [Micromonospora aurantiaca]MDG4752351.1 acyl carrier protein [Micromonospora sp. WMMD718]RNI07010.1 acyl carrier protein [Micromonospora aurantiaca]UFN92182.1 acyl carrier protein [Micromonospora aurantiaca]SCL43684.1 polyketide biosynthesis acyl carrier protein [Micromonospora aurantiaca]